MTEQSKATVGSTVKAKMNMEGCWNQGEEFVVDKMNDSGEIHIKCHAGTHWVAVNDIPVEFSLVPNGN